MTTVKSAKIKGSQAEYDVQYSLSQKYPKVYLTKQLGFQQQYDIRNDEGFKFVVEVKRLKGISWNQAVAFFDNLQSVAPEGYVCFLIFQSNRQPPLVMFRALEVKEDTYICTFESVFRIPFLKHPSTRPNKKVPEVKQ